MCEYFNGTPSRAISPVEKSEIGSGVLPFNRDETKASFVRGNNRFSLFKWLKRGHRDSTAIGKRRKRVSGKSNNLQEQNLSSSTETFYSTTTVHSFAFQAGVFQECNNLSLDFPRQLSDIGPFGSGAVKLLEKKGNANINYTLPNTFLQKKDFTERYSLQPLSTFNSCGNIPTPVTEWNKSCNSLKGKKVHVKGKRRAPNPPDLKSKNISNNAEQSSFKTKRRTRRQAPKPPDEANLKVDRTININSEIPNNQEICPIISTDTLILRGGILLPKNSSECTVKISNINSTEETASDAEISQEKESETSSSIKSFDKAMPRPWYKRSDSNTASKKDFHTNSISNEKKEDCSSSATSPYFPFDGSLSKLNFFHRTERNSEDKRKDAKRKSGISILTNISELDREAAAIVQEGSRDEKFAVNKDLIHDNSSARRGTRTLISKFNAITNVNYFSKNSPTSQRSNRFDLNDRIREQNVTKENEKRVENKQDLSKYLNQRSPKLESHFNQNKIDSNLDNQIIIQRSHENFKTLSNNNISEKESFSLFNKTPSLKIDKKKEPENCQVEVNNKSDIENASSLSFNKKPFNKKLFQNNAPPIIIRELDLIFNEIDKQLESNIMKSKYNNSKTEVKASTSNQISKSLEKERISKLIQPQNINVTKEKLCLLDDPVTMDLKEILKEMKHSLPKRTKAKKIVENHLENINVNNKPSTSTFNDLNAFNTTTTTSTTNLKEDILEKPKTPLYFQEKSVTDVREEKKHKVSSAVQTSGNVRKVNNLPSTSKQNMNHDAIYRKSEYEVSPKFKLNKFHLIRPKEFDEIEAIKLVKTPWLENIYANVSQQPSCSNRIILPLKPVINVQPSELLLKRKEEVKKNNPPFSARFNQQEILILPGKL